MSNEGTITIKSQLQYGMRCFMPETVKACWGARLIYPNDMVHDRVSIVGGDRPKTELRVWLKRVWPQAAKTLQALAKEGRMLRDGYTQVVVFEDEHGIMAANPQGSCGYVYIGAYLKAHA